MLPYWKTLVSAQGPGNSISNTTTATSLLLGTTQANFGLAASYLERPGDVLMVEANGDISNIVTTPGTLTLDVRLGGTVVATSGTIQLSTTAHTTLPFWLRWTLTTKTVGSAASFMPQGFAFSQAFSLAADSTTTLASAVPIPATAPAAGNTFDSRIVQQFDMFATFSIANSGNLIQLQQAILISCG